MKMMGDKYNLPPRSVDFLINIASNYYLIIIFFHMLRFEYLSSLRI